MYIMSVQNCLKTFMKKTNRFGSNPSRIAIKKQRPWKWKGRYLKPSGKTIWFEGHSIPTRHKDEIIFDGIFIDITDKIEQEIALRQAKKDLEISNIKLEQRVDDRTAQLDQKTEKLMETNVALKFYWKSGRRIKTNSQRR